MHNYLKTKVRLEKKERRAVDRGEEHALHSAQAGCEGKRKFTTFDEAHRNLSRNTDTKLPGRLNTYKCKVCHHYHNGRSNIQTGVHRKHVAEVAVIADIVEES